MEKARVEFTVNGYVQGVGFRFFVYRNDIMLDLVGYTKNMYDGSVLVEVEGKPQDIDALLEKLKIGPSRSRVESVKRVEKAYTGEFKEFKIK